MSPRGVTIRGMSSATPSTAAPAADSAGIRPRGVDQLCVDTIRMLAVDMVNAANSGHPGMPMGAADMAYVLWTRFLRYDPGAADWRDRDRFVLSAGHGSALLYALLHLSGYDLSLDDLRDFRQFESRTPGHPEAGLTEGVEVTTGPLGQGFANSVGIALAQKMLAARFSTPEHPACSHRTFSIVGDGCLMEGISAEAASMAGHLGLGNLVVLYDSNRISIDGSTDLTFTEDVAARFRACGWQVLDCDGHDREAIAVAVEGALADAARPSLVICRTKIGKGSPNREGSEKSHGAALGPAETALTKAAYGWPDEPTFLVAREVYERFAARAEEGSAARARWTSLIADWAAVSPDAHAAWDAYFTQDLPSAEHLLARLLHDWEPGKAATRKHSGAVIQRLASMVPNLVGGSADLAGSNQTWIKGSPGIGPSVAPGDDMSFAGRNICFGVREHAMGAVMNGMATQGAFIPYGATFLAFLDYMRAPVRLASLSGHGSIFVYTHDSIGVGEDGPTHQPIEHLWTARMIPGMVVHRPADGPETAAAWADAVARRDGPTMLVLTRQGLPPLPRAADASRSDLLRGGYVVVDGVDVVLIATGSEVSLALDARDLLAADGVSARVVSMPSVELFDAQDAAWRDSVLPEGPPRVAIEAGRTDGWYRFVGRDGLVLGIDGFGCSAPASAAFDHFGLTPEKVAARVANWLSSRA